MTINELISRLVDIGSRLPLEEAEVLADAGVRLAMTDTAEVEVPSFPLDGAHWEIGYNDTRYLGQSHGTLKLPPGAFVLQVQDGVAVWAKRR